MNFNLSKEKFITKLLCLRHMLWVILLVHSWKITRGSMKKNDKMIKLLQRNRKIPLVKILQTYISGKKYINRCGEIIKRLLYNGMEYMDIQKDILKIKYKKCLAWLKKNEAYWRSLKIFLKLIADVIVSMFGFDNHNLLN